MKKYVCIISLIVLMVIGVSSVYAEQQLKLGIIQPIVDHPDHIVLRESFLDELKGKGYDVEVTLFNADVVTYPETYTVRVAEEAKRMEAAGIQMIYCTGVYHGVIQANVKIPVIDSVMTAPLLLHLAEVKEDGNMYCIESNATGTMFGYSFKDIAAFARDALPDAQKMAYLYNPKSPYSRPLAEIKEAASKVGFEVVDCPFTNKDEVLTAIEKAAKNSKIAFATNDLAASGTEKEAIAVAMTKSYPLIVGVLPIVELGALAGIQYDWERAARMCAEKADQILKGTIPNTIPVESPDQFEIGLNLKVAEKLKIEIPYEWIEFATKVIE